MGVMNSSINSDILYFSSKNCLETIGFITHKIISNISKNHYRETTPKVLELSTNIFLSAVCESEFTKIFSNKTKETLELVALMIDSLLTELNKEFSQEVVKLIKLFKKSKALHLQIHSVLCSFIAIEIVRTEIWYSNHVKKTINLMSFFHDLLLIPIYIRHPNAPLLEEELLSFEALSEREKNLVKYHPREMSTYLKNLSFLPPMIDQFILQHHGNTSGEFNVDIRPNDDILYLSKVLYVADIISIEILKSKELVDDFKFRSILEQTKNQLHLDSYRKLLASLYKVKM
jgi:hypothetical protein